MEQTAYPATITNYSRGPDAILRSGEAIELDYYQRPRRDAYGKITGFVKEPSTDYDFKIGKLFFNGYEGESIHPQT